MSDYPEMPAFLDRRTKDVSHTEPPVVYRNMDGNAMVQGKWRAEFPKPLVFTYTMLNTYLICPHQCFRRYIKKDLKFVETPEMKWGNEVHTAMEHRMGGKPLPENMRQWEPIVAPIAALQPRAELKLGITAEGKPTGFWDKDVFFRGKADVVVIRGTAAFLPDWKTSRKPREDPFELATNGMLVHAHNPQLTKLGGAYVWLKENRIGPSHDVSDTRSTWAKVSNLAEEIRDCQADNDWEKKAGPLCAWCDCFDCENNTNPKKP